MVDIQSIERFPGQLQQPVPPELLEQLTCSAFGTADPLRSIVEIGSGTFNNTYHVTFASSRRVILRVAPGGDARIFRHEAGLMRRDYAIQPFLAPIRHLLPRTLVADFSHELISRDYMFQSFLPGDIWGEVKSTMTDEENQAVWRQLGVLAGRLNLITGDAFGCPAPFPRFPSWSRFVEHELNGMIQDAVDLAFDPADAVRLLGLIQRHRRLLDHVQSPGLAHGDLWPNNIVIGRSEGKPVITGILDTERAYWGDPLMDWTFSYYDVPDAFYDAFRTVMGIKRGRTEMQDEREIGPEFRRLVYRGVCSAMFLIDSTRGWANADQARLQLKEVNEQLEKLLEDRTSRA